MTGKRGAPTGRTGPRAPGRGLRFVALSGLGWLLDTAVFVILIAGSNLSVMAANVAGGACGAAFAFTTSSRWVFAGRPEGLAARLAVYLAYTIALIFAASALVDLTARLVADALAWWGSRLPQTVVAFLAKCLVTPLTLVANFYVARFLIERSARPSERADHDRA